MSLMIKRAVGEGASNAKGDVAIIQFALKYASGGPFYNGSVDGRKNTALVTALALFMAKNKLKGLPKIAVTKGGALLKVLEQAMSGKLRGKRLVAITRGSQLHLLVIDPKVGRAALQRASTLAVPYSDATALYRSLRRVQEATGVVLQASDPNVDVNGRFEVRLTPQNVEEVDLTSGRFRSPGRKFFSYFLHRGDLDGWTTPERRPNIFFTKRRYRFFRGNPVLYPLERTAILDGMWARSIYAAKLTIAAAQPLKKEVARVSHWSTDTVAGLFTGEELEGLRIATRILYKLEPKMAQQIIKVYDRRRNAFEVVVDGLRLKPMLFAGYEANFFVGGGVTVSAGLIFDPQTKREYVFLTAGSGFGVDIGFSGQNGAIFVNPEDFAGPGYAASGAIAMVGGGAAFTPKLEMASVSFGVGIGLPLGFSMAETETWIFDVDFLPAPYEAWLDLVVDVLFKERRKPWIPPTLTVE